MSDKVGKVKSIILVKLSRHIGRFPLGPAYLIGTVKAKTEFKAHFFDEACYITKEEKSPEECLGVFKELFREANPSYVGFTLYQEEIGRFIEYARFIKSYNKNCRIIVGGSDVTAFGEHLLANIPEIDIAVKGEGELILSKILNEEKLENIPNLAFKEGGKIVETERKLNYNFDIDEIPLPSSDEFDLKLYAFSHTSFFRMKPTATLIFSRGCSGNCSFCTSKQIYGRHRIRKPADVIDEIENLLVKYPFVKNLYFTDNYFPLNHPDVHEFFELYRNKRLHRRVSFGVQTKIAAINEKSIEILKKNRCSYVGFGIENFASGVQAKMAKSLPIKTFEEKYALLRKSGLFVNYYFILNYPGMSYEELMFNIQMIEKYQLGFLTLGSLMPNPGTRIFDELVAAGSIPPLTDPSIDWHSDFIRSHYAAQDYIGLTEDQKRAFDAYLKKKKASNDRYFLMSLPLRQKLDIVYQRTGLNPIRLLNWIGKKAIPRVIGSK